MTPAEIRRLSPSAMAYVGDAVYELYVRLHFLMPPKRLKRYHGLVVERVRAEYQSQLLRSLEPLLTPDELDLVRRGRNATTKAPRRMNLETYQRATGFEALIGYLYLTNPERLSELLQHLNVTSSSDASLSPHLSGMTHHDT